MSITILALAVGCACALAMALAKTVVPVLLRGLDQKAPKQTGVTGAVESMLNFYAAKGVQGGYEFIHRPGVGSLAKTADSGTISSGMRLATLGSSLLLFTGSACYRKALDEFHLVAPTVPVVGVQTSPIVANTLRASACDSVYVAGYTVDVTLADGNVYVTVTDSAGATVVSKSVDTGTFDSIARVVATTSEAVIVWSTAAGTVKAAKVSASSPSIVSAATTITTVASFTGFQVDAQLIPATGKVVIMWRDVGTSQLNQTLLTPSTMTIAGTTAYASLTGLSASYLTNDYSTNVIYVGHVGPSGLRITTFDGSTLALSATTVFDAATTSANAIAGYRTGASVSVYITTGASAAYDWRIQLSTGGAVASVVRGLKLASTVLSANGTLYAMVQYQGVGQGTYFLFDLVARVAIGKAMPDVAFADTDVTRSLPTLRAAGSASTWLTSGLKNIAVVSGAGTSLAAYVGASTMTFTYQDATVGRGVELNGGVHIPGAMPYLYDGSTITEEGFPIAPEQSDAPVLAAGGGLTAGATYTYRYVYEWTDAAGNIHHSAPSIVPQSVAMGANTKVTLAIPTLRLTRKTGVAVAVYRTPANGDGSVYYKVNSPTSPLLNDPTVDRAAFVDTVADTALVSGEPLYVNGFILENIAPPPCKAMAVHRGRLLVGGVDGDPEAVWFSKDVSPGFGVAFNDGLVSRLNATSEAITAVGSMDSYALACTATTTWGSSDDYPDDTGNGGVLRFSQISSQVGCTSATTMARTDQGMHVWAGTKGAWRLSRGLTYDYVGAPEETDAQSMTTPVALLSVPSLNQVRYVGAGSIAGTNFASMALVYESIFGTWGGWGYTFAGAVADAVIWSGQVAYLSNNGTVIVEQAQNVDDDGVSVGHSITLSGLNFGGVAGFQRIYATQITGQVSGARTIGASQTIDGTVIATKSMLASGSALNMEFDPGNAGKCSTYQVTIFDSGLANDNSSWTVAAVTMLVGAKPGLNRLPPARRMT